MKRIISVMLTLAVALSLCCTVSAAQGSVNSNNAMGTPDNTPGETTVPDGTTHATESETVHAPGTGTDETNDGSDMRAVLIAVAVIAGIVLLAVIIYLAVKKSER